MNTFDFPYVTDGINEAGLTGGTLAFPIAHYQTYTIHDNTLKVLTNAPDFKWMISNVEMIIRKAFHFCGNQLPHYLKVLSVLLVPLVAAAASYAVFLRPLNELIVNPGALVLGVWGIRAIMVPGASSFVSEIDLALSTVILSASRYQHKGDDFFQGRKQAGPALVAMQVF